MEPINTALTHVQGENANKLSQGIFKMVKLMQIIFMNKNLY